MAAIKAASVSVRIDANIKTQAEAILQKLGISRATAIDMFYRQIIMQNGIPFPLTNEDYMVETEYRRLRNILQQEGINSTKEIKKSLISIASRLAEDIEQADQSE